MDYLKDLSAIAEFIKGSRRILITSHIKIDGDGLGSELSLKRALVSLGKEVKVINDCKVPSNLSFLLIMIAKLRFLMKKDRRISF